MSSSTNYLVTKDTQSQFNDDVYLTMVNQIEEIRSAISMYVSPLGTSGGLHLCKEIMNNAIDEAMNPKSTINSGKICLIFDETVCKFTIIDEGRGIPLDLIKDAVCKKHMSTKTIGKTNRNKDLAGMNGVGLTVVAALSEYMSITSYRGTKCKTLEFNDGTLNEGEIKRLSKKRYGTEVSIIPSEKYLGRMDLTCDVVEEYLRHMSYTLRGNLSIYYEGICTDGSHRKILYNRKGLGENVNFLSSSLEFRPIELACENDDFGLEVAFSYDRTLDETICDSYANYIITTEGGTHEQIAQRAICEYLAREAKALDPNNKVEVTYEDCKRGLVLAVNCRHVTPVLEGQHKTRFSSPDVLKSGRGMLLKVLGEYFRENQSTLRKIVVLLRQIAKARLETNKIKGVSTSKKPTSLLEDAAIPQFFNIANRHYKGYKELYICEGESAAGALLNCRNAEHQALYGLFGVMDNVYDMNLTQIMKTDVFSKLVTILGCGIGKDFDVTRLRYNKIIICADSDSDGRNITSLLLCFFLRFMPKLIEDGYIFKAMPPLYLLDMPKIKKIYHGRSYLYDKRELYEIENSLIADNVEIAIDINDGEEIRVLSKKEAVDWLDKNSEYLLELNNLSKRCFCPATTIVEYAVYYKVFLEVVEKTEFAREQRFGEIMTSIFPEMTYDTETKSLVGVWNFKQFSLICDELFIHNALRFIPVLMSNPGLFVYVRNKNVSGTSEEYDKMTIGEFLNSMGTKFKLPIDQRFKGLGEAEADLLFLTTMNPKTRKLLRITMPDKTRAEDVFKLLHQKSKPMIEQRRNLLDTTTISYADIDN